MIKHDERTVIRISGTDNSVFLQGLITNDLPGEDNKLVYAALLTPQGKYLFDFFLFRCDRVYLLDIKSDQVDAFVKRLLTYRLRSKVVIEKSSLNVGRGLTNSPAGAFDDPRSHELGWRHYSDKPMSQETVDWDGIRVRNCIPETGIELIQNKTFILETGFERLNGVDFKKGCYVGQEVTARMKHKTSLQKGLARVIVSGRVPVGTPITSDGKPVGTLYSQSGNRGIAYLYFNRVKGVQEADGAQVSLDPH